MTMDVRVLFFGQLVDVTGCCEVIFSLPDDHSVGALAKLIIERWPGFARWEHSLLWAINMQFATRREIIPSGAEVAVMPPVQGG